MEARAFREGDDLVVEVEDSGIGIPAEHLSRIFEEFHQVDGSYARKYQGTGLGLALVRTMVGMHGGSVSVRSAPAEGSTFTCRFPSCAGSGPEVDLGKYSALSEIPEVIFAGPGIRLVANFGSRL